MIGINVPDKSDRSGMSGRKTKELATAGAWFPFRNLLAILKAGIQNINRASKDPSASKVVATGAGTTEDFNRRESVGFRDMVVEPGCV
jgi:hypothetical protein